MIDLTHFFPGTFILHMTRYLIMFNIVHAILKDQYNVFATFVAIISSGFVFSWISVDFLPAKYEVLFIIGFIFLLFIICTIFCNGSIPSRFLACVTAFISTTLPPLILQIFYSLTNLGNPSFLYETTIDLATLLNYCLFMYVFSFLLVLLIKLFKIKVLKNEIEIKTSKSIYFYIFPITHILCLFSITISEQAMTVNQVPIEYINKFRLPALIFNIICFVIDISIVFFAEHVNNLEIKNIENEKKIITTSMTYEQTNMLKKEKSEFRKIKHDMSNLITTATGFIDIGKPEKAKEILRSTGNSILNGSGTNYCSDETLNTVIYLKKLKADDFGVQLITNVNEAAAIKIDGYDLCRLVHNIIDNSINAAQKTEVKISKIDIHVMNDFITISSSNHFVTNKKTVRNPSKNHGYGTQIIKEIAKKYNGNYDVKITGDTYTTEATIDNLKI